MSQTINPIVLYGWKAQDMSIERLEAHRMIRATPSTIFEVLCDPNGHVAIDSSGMLMAATGDRVEGLGDSFVVHMDRESLGDVALGQYDVSISITRFEPDAEIAWTILVGFEPEIGHVYGYSLEAVDGGTLVTSYYDWSEIHPNYAELGIFPVISQPALRATLGILARTVQTD